MKEPMQKFIAARTLSSAMIRLLFGLAVLASGCGQPASAPVTNKAESPVVAISVAAAADLKFAFEEILAEFRKIQPDVRVEVTFGSSGNFFSQLSNKAPFDLFFSADIDYPRKLIEQGVADPATEFQYAIGHIGIWVRNDSPLDLNQSVVAVLSDPRNKKIAIANPRFAPYGRAAEAALKHLKIYDTLQDRLVLGDNISQTAQFIESGAADIGIIAASLANGSPLKDQGRFALFPQESHPPLRQGGLILSWAVNKQACQQLKAFVLSDVGQTILAKYGFDRPDH